MDDGNLIDRPGNAGRTQLPDARWRTPNVPLEDLLRVVKDDGRQGVFPGARRAGRGVPRNEPNGSETASLAPAETADLLASALEWFVPPLLARRHASTLLERHGTLGAVLAASSERLAGQLESRDAAAFLKVIQALVIAVVREPIQERPLINSPSALDAYLRASLRHEPVECVRLLFLNGGNRLIGEEVHSRGTVNHCPLYPREVVRRVIEMNANALILVHNHPSGDPTPSPQDSEMTRNLAQTLKRIGVSLHDHVIAGANTSFSFRSHKLLDGI
ncbi:MAG: DNA repair protein RadC [Geminicoccaceae bacterium]|nr:MAG: DNA repair protein RadC [Geminicoccaceae bacterium]